MGVGAIPKLGGDRGFGGCCGHLTLLLKGIFPNLEGFFKLFS